MEEIPRAFAAADAHSDDAEYQRLALEELIDRERIRDVLARYSRGIDRLDRNLTASVYWPGAVDEHAIFSGTADEFLDWSIPNMGATVTSQQHFMSPPLIRITGNEAAVETYFTCPQYVRPPGVTDGPLLEMAVGGRYVDRMEKRGREWRIMHRTVVLDWQRITPEYDHHWEGGPVGAIPMAHRGLLNQRDASETLFPRHDRPATDA